MIGIEFSAVQWKLFPLWASVVRGLDNSYKKFYKLSKQNQTIYSKQFWQFFMPKNNQSQFIRSQMISKHFIDIKNILIYISSEFISTNCFLCSLNLSLKTNRQLRRNGGKWTCAGLIPGISVTWQYLTKHSGHFYQKSSD